MHQRTRAVVDVERDLVSIPTRPQWGDVVDRLPDGVDWRFEPDWDGLRVTARLGPGDARLISERGRDFDRFFPESVSAIQALPLDNVIVRGSLVVVGKAGLEFDSVRQRLHPSPARVTSLATAAPATLVLTDIVGNGSADLRASPIGARRRQLESLAAELDIAVAPTNLRHMSPGRPVVLTPQTLDRNVARSWLLDRDASGRDGVIARHADGRRWVRVRRVRTAECVVTGFRRSGSGEAVRLGLYDGGRLIDVGRTVAVRRAPTRRVLAAALAAVSPGGDGGTSGGSDWVDVPPVLVCAVRYERLRGVRFRKAVTFLRWLPDRDPACCTVEQLER